MLAPSGELLRAGVALKLNHLKRAARSYVRDRADQATDRATSYAVAAALFAAAGLFGIAACFVGLFALFRWVEFSYGLFWACGAVGAVLLVAAAICAGVALARLKPLAGNIPSLASRLRVAIASPTMPRGTVKGAVREVASTIPLAPLAPGETGARGPAWPVRNARSLQLGLMLGALGLLGYTAARRVRRGRPPHRADA